MISEGSPIPSITLEIRECSGLIVVTTLMSAFADRLRKREVIPKNIAF